LWVCEVVYINTNRFQPMYLTSK